MPDSHIFNVRIRTWQDGDLIWEPVKFQIEIDHMMDFEWRQNTMPKFSETLILKPFLWSAESGIVIDNKLVKNRARIVFDPGCSGETISQAWADQFKIVPTKKPHLQ